MNKLLPLITINIFSLFSITTVLADEVVLKNGSHLIGEVQKKDGSTLEFKTPFAGTIKIKWQNIVTLTTDKAVKLMLQDDSTRMANIIKIEGEVAKISNVSEDEIQIIKQSDMAYINPEPWRLGEAHKITGDINISLKSQRGNTDNDEFDLDSTATLRRKNDRIKFAGEYESDKGSGEQTALNWLFLGKYDYFISDKTFWGGSFLFEHDEFADLDLRETYGVHVGHQYFESKAINLSVEAGLAQVYENFLAASDDDYAAGTWGVKYDQYFLDEYVQFYHRQIGRFNLEGSNKFLFKSWTGLRFPLLAGFRFSAEAQADYNSQPATGVDKTDTTYRFKLGYAF